jgi:hypothetical protein
VPETPDSSNAAHIGDVDSVMSTIPARQTGIRKVQ